MLDEVLPDAEHPNMMQSNFSALQVIEPLLFQLGSLAERYLLDDPNTAMLKLRQYGELLAQVVAARSGQLGDADETQQARLARLQRDGVLPREVWQLLTVLRRTGNEANHAFTGERERALELLRFAWIVGVWLLRTFHDPDYARGEFRVRRRDATSPSPSGPPPAAPPTTHCSWG